MLSPPWLRGDSSKQSSNLLNIKSSFFPPVTNSKFHTQIYFHSCNTPYSFKFILFTKTHMYTTIHFFLTQPTLSTLHLDFLYILTLNLCENTHNTKLKLLCTKPAINLIIHPYDLSQFLWLI